MGLFSAECHGGARWHVGIMNRRESPFEEIARFRELMPSVLLQTLIRETNLFGYRPYPKRVIEHVVARVDIDVWRCFSFLNDVRNMRAVAETVLARGRLFQPTISFTSVGLGHRRLLPRRGARHRRSVRRHRRDRALHQGHGRRRQHHAHRPADRRDPPALAGARHRLPPAHHRRPGDARAAGGRQGRREDPRRRGGLARALLRALADPRGAGLPRGVRHPGAPRARRGRGRREQGARVGRRLRLGRVARSRASTTR